MITRAHVIEGSAAEAYRLGIVTMRLLAGSDRTNGAFALGEFAGGDGPWTVPHVHENSEESFYVLDGSFTFTIAEDEVEAGPGAFILVPRGTRHLMRAGAGGGRLLTLWTPGGLEAMFVELSRLPADSLRDPATRKAMSARFDSVPV
jgi:mannose-6-phosphate isomerase-like protein (cupin superfamily)